jgi:hypothetical protein
MKVQSSLGDERILWEDDKSMNTRSKTIVVVLETEEVFYKITNYKIQP